MEICSFCKSSIKKGERYCPTCGKAVREAAEAFILPNFDSVGAGEAPTGRGNNREAPGTREITSGNARQRPGARRNRPGASKRLIVLVSLLIVVASTYLYMMGVPGGSKAAEEYLNKVLRTRGFDVTAKMESDGKVVVTGKVQSDDDRNAALAIVRSENKVRSIADNITVALLPADLERGLKRALEEAGLSEVEAKVGHDFIVALSGTAHGRQDKDTALAITRGRQGVKGVDDGIEIRKSSSQDKASIPGKAGDTTTDFTQAAHFEVAALSPSTWASKKYSSSLTFRVPGPGRILVEADWQRPGALALILNNAESHDTYTQKDGTSPLKLVYRITEKDLARGSLWEAAVANFTSSGPFEGSLKLTFLSGEANRPFTMVREANFDLGRIEGEINTALKTAGIKGVSAEVAKDRSVTLTGSVRTIGEKQRAIETARKFKAIKEVKDVIFVVG